MSCCRCRVVHLFLLNFTALLLVQSSNLVRSPWREALLSCVSIAYMYFTEWECAWKTELYCGGKNVQQHSQKHPWLFDAWVFLQNKNSAMVCSNWSGTRELGMDLRGAAECLSGVCCCAACKCLLLSVQCLDSSFRCCSLCSVPSHSKTPLLLVENSFSDGWLLSCV